MEGREGEASAGRTTFQKPTTAATCNHIESVSITEFVSVGGECDEDAQNTARLTYQPNYYSHY